MRNIFLCGALLAMSLPASAQFARAQVPTPVTIVGGSVISTPSSLSYQGSLTLAATTSTALSTMTLSNSTVLPATYGKMTIINVGAATAYVCWTGGTCAATGGSELLAAGASDTVYGLGGTSPTAYSTAGTTLAIHN